LIEMNLFFIAYLFVIVSEYVGLGYEFRIIQKLHLPLLTVLLLFMYLMVKNGTEVFSSKLAKMLMVFVALTFFAMAHSYVATYSLNAFKAHFGYFMLFVIGYYLLDSPKRLEQLAKVYVLIFIYLIFINIEKLGGARVGHFRAGYFLGDGNDFGWGILVALPYAIYLFRSSSSIVKKVLAATAAIVLLFGIVGTQSRGASLALAASMVYLFVFSGKSKVAGIVTLLVMGLVAIPFLPDKYLGRMETVKSYEEDNSAMARIRAWTSATQMALDHPILGVGAGNFPTAFGRFYLPKDAPTGKWYNAHSIYFLTLGEYGFPGIIILISIIVANFKTNRATLLLIQQTKDGTVPEMWPNLINMGLIAYSVGGMFLGGLNYPHIYVISGVTLALHRMAKKELETSKGEISEESEKQVPIRRRYY